MKKMKRFLSLLICMVMLMSFLPMSASAAEITEVTIDLPDTTGKTISQALSSITATANVGTLNMSAIGWNEKDGVITATFSLTAVNGYPYDYDREYFSWYNLKVSASGFEQKNLQHSLVNGPNYTQRLDITMKFPKPHQHEWSYQDDGSEGHYPVCSCNVTTEIEDHKYGEDGTALVCSLCNYNRGVKVTFVNDKGTAPEAQNIVKGTAATNPGTPACDIAAAYTFDGWYLGDDKFDFDTLITESITLTAKWTPNKFDIVFVNDGTEVSSAELPYGDPIVVPETPKKEGYTFNGWGEVPSTVPAEDKTFTAQWSINQYTITFVTDGGTEITPITQDYKTAVTAPADPEREGYTFKAWDKTVPATMPAENMTITAIWTVNQYTITFDTDGGNEIAPITQDYNTAVTAPADPEKEGYDFAGWDKTIPGTMPAENVTITAQWTPVVASVTVTPESVKLPAGTVYEDFVATVVAGGDLSKDVKWTIAPAAPAEEGIALLSDEETTIDENTGVLTANKPGKYIVTATSLADETKSDTAEVEVLEVYTITYKLDNGTVATANPTTYTVETADIKLTNPTKAGYTFAGWTGTGLEKATMEVTIAKGSTGNREYTATWTQNVAPVTYFKVTYDANKGTGEMPEVSVEAGKDHTLLANEFKAPAGKTFKCWKIGTKEYKAGEKIEVTENVTVKAVWKNKTASSDLDYVPAAGDNFPTFLWAGLLLFSVVALVEVVVLRRKRS